MFGAGVLAAPSTRFSGILGPVSVGGHTDTRRRSELSVPMLGRG